LTDELLEEFEPDIEQITLIPSDDGRFEVEINGELVYSKLSNGRHAQAGEVAGLVRRKLQG
jgi:selenoprotein W-related protein